MKMAKCPVCGIMVKNLKYHYRRNVWLILKVFNLYKILIYHYRFEMELLKVKIMVLFVVCILIKWMQIFQIFKTEVITVCSKCSEKIERSTCNICDKSFCNKRSLETHIKHIHEKVLEHQCHVCEHKTYSKYNLR